MSRTLLRACAMTFSLALLHGASAQAQLGYPGGYGGYGWGGWGGETGEGDIARGLGAYAMDAGFYNKETAVANAIDADTVARWNQYVYESQMNANRMHAEKLAATRARANLADNQSKSRLRKEPEQADIYSGDALNAALDVVNDPRVYKKTLQGAKVKIGGQTIRNIPFEKASAAITMSIHQLLNGRPPRALMAPKFANDRAVLNEVGQEFRNGIDSEKAPDKATIDKMLTAVNQIEADVDTTLAAKSKDRVEADRYLKALHGLIAMLDTPAMDVLLSGVEKRPEATLGDLLGFMNAFNFRFGAATTAQQREAYDVLYPKLVDLKNQVAPALSDAAASKSGEYEPGEFFSGMPYKDLQKRAPAPPKPGTRTQP